MGYDIEIGLPDGRLRLIRGKGWTGGASTITMTRSEILHSFDMPEAYILSLVEFFENGDHEVRYARQPYRKDVDFEASSVR